MAASASTLLAAGSPARGLVVLAAVLVAPGWAVLTLTGASGPLGPQAAAAFGVSLGVAVLGSVLLVWLGLGGQATAVLLLGGAGIVLLLARDLARTGR